MHKSGLKYLLTLPIPKHSDFFFYCLFPLYLYIIWEFPPYFRRNVYMLKVRIYRKDKYKNAHVGLPGGAVVKNPPANAGDTGSSPGLRRSHVPGSNEAHVPQLLSLCSRAREPQLLKPTRLEPVLRNKRSHRNEKPAHRNEE